MGSNDELECHIIKYQNRLASSDHNKVVHALRRLEQAAMTLSLLTSTGVGKTVNGLRHDSQLGDRAKALVNKWKDIVSDSIEEDEQEFHNGHSKEIEKIVEIQAKVNPESTLPSKKLDKKRKLEDSEISCDNGISFLDVLSMADTSVSKKKVDKVRPKKPKCMEEPETSSSPPPLGDIDWQKILPTIDPCEYKPRSVSELIIGGQHLNGVNNTSKRRMNGMLDTRDPNSFKRKNDRTQVFAGRGGSGLKSVPTLYDACIRVICDNVDAIEDTGSIPYGMLKPALEKATPAQLYYIEENNAYLTEDTEELWEEHCRALDRNSKPSRKQTWRALYQVLVSERDSRLKKLAAKVSHKQAAVKSEVRTAKLAVDVVPREVRRKQAKFGTRPRNVATAEEIVATRRMIDECDKRQPIPFKKTSIYRPASSSERTHVIETKKKPKLAPGMAKTLKLFAKTKTRR